MISALASTTFSIDESRMREQRGHWICIRCSRAGDRWCWHLLHSGCCSRNDSTLLRSMCAKLLQCVRLFAAPRSVVHQAPRPWNFPGRNTGMGCHALLQGLFPAQGSNSRLLFLLLWQVGSFTTRFPKCLNCEEYSCQLQETRVQSLGRGDPLEKEMATCSSILAWKIQWREEPCSIYSMRLQRVRLICATEPLHSSEDEGEGESKTD